jgi:hypothetical protein
MRAICMQLKCGANGARLDAFTPVHSELGLCRQRHLDAGFLN